MFTIVNILFRKLKQSDIIFINLKIIVPNIFVENTDLISEEEPSLLNFMKQEIPPLVSNETKRLQPFRRIDRSDQTREIQDLVNTQGLQSLNRRVQSFEEYRRML